jgi:hypothetical protein
MRENAKPWNGLEPIADVLARFGYSDLFGVCVAGGSRDTAIRLLIAAGVDDATASRIVELALKAIRSVEN